MSFGYVDCSSEKTLCAEHNIRKYPTIKYVTNHVIHDYYGRNSLRSLVEVCDSLSRSSYCCPSYSRGLARPRSQRCRNEQSSKAINRPLLLCLCTSGTVVFRRTTLPKVSISSISSRTRPSTSSSTRFVPTSPFILEIRCHEDLADHASPHPAALRHSSGKRGGPAVLSSLRRRGAADDDVDSSAHLAAAPGGRDFTESST